MIVVVFLLDIYYNVILAWAWYYLFASFTSVSTIPYITMLTIGRSMISLRMGSMDGNRLDLFIHFPEITHKFQNNFVRRAPRPRNLAPARLNSPMATGIAIDLRVFYILRFQEVFEYEQICVCCESEL